MFKNYVKIAFRNLVKNKSYSAINISGLAISLACAILILLWVQDEISFDGFHENRAQIYRVTSDFQNNSGVWASTPGPLAEALPENIPEVNYAAPFRSRTNNLVRYGDKMFMEDGVAVTTSSFFKIFSFKFILGDPNTALTSPNHIVLTESMAQKYFSDENPINKQIDVDENLLTVAGVIEDVPQNSHMQFKSLISFEAAQKQTPLLQSWGRYPIYTYVQLTENANPEIVGEKIKQLIVDASPNHPERKYALQPLSEIHFTNTLFNDDATTTNRNYIFIFSGIAVFILLIACINYMSLSTARYANRIKEIGLKKVIGASRRNLIWQFLGESLFITFISFTLALILVEIIRPFYNSIIGKNLVIPYTEPLFLGFLFSLILITGILAGSYPALYLSSFQPVHIFKISHSSGRKRFNFRQALTVFQFSLSIALIIGMFVINRQVRFLIHKNLGFEKANTVCVRINSGTIQDYEPLKNELARHPEIKNVSVKNCSPEVIYRATQGVNWQGKDSDDRTLWEVSWVDEAFFKDLDIGFSAGRNFSKEFTSDENESVIINETGAKIMNLQNPIGTEIEVYHQKRKIVGIIKDANFHSLHKQVEPQIFLLLTEDQIAGMGCMFLIRFENDLVDGLAATESIWRQMVPNYPFEFSFLDERYARLYDTEQKVQRLFNGFTFMAIFISCLGLLGLASFMAEKRTKEIGVRKVLGASIFQILTLLSKEFTRWILLANIIAWPIAWLAMNKWLHNFAYRIDLSWWMFALAGGLALLIALLTVSWQAVRAAVANPVEALRYE